MKFHIDYMTLTKHLAEIAAKRGLTVEEILG
jgi:hypothetical protein